VVSGMMVGGTEAGCHRTMAVRLYKNSENLHACAQKYILCAKNFVQCAE